MTGRELPSGALLFDFPQAYPNHPVVRLAAHPNGKSFGIVRWGEELRGFYDHKGHSLPAFAVPISCSDLVFSPTGELFAAPTTLQTVAFYETESGALFNNYGMDTKCCQNLEKATSVSFSPDGERFATARWNDEIRIYDLDEPNIEGRAIHGIMDVAWSPDGNQLAAGIGERNKGSNNVHLQIVRLAISVTPLLAAVEEAPSAVLFTPDGHHSHGD